MKTIVDYCVRFLGRGWHTRAGIAPMISWRPRKWNTLADALANLAMDEGRSFRFVDEELMTHTKARGGYLLQWHVDGGLRESGVAARACTVTLTCKVGDTLQRRVLFAAAEPLFATTSAALSERMAMKMAIEFMHSFTLLH